MRPTGSRPTAAGSAPSTCGTTASSHGGQGRFNATRGILRRAARPAQGVPLMFVAGLGDDHSSWAEPVEVLSQSFRCITFDNRGIGRSVITPGPYSTRSMAEDAEAVAVALGLDAVDAIGSSMGGAICQEWA